MIEVAMCKTSYEAGVRKAVEVLNDEKMITAHLLREWDREKIIAFALHLLGDKCQECWDKKSYGR
jgi:hypothetical protein